MQLPSHGAGNTWTHGKRCTLARVSDGKAEEQVHEAVLCNTVLHRGWETEGKMCGHARLAGFKPVGAVPHPPRFKDALGGRNVCCCGH
jgi:hypothetical protein